MKKFSLYYYEASLLERDPDKWIYKIYEETPREFVPVRESSEWFDSKGRAELAAIGHIHLLENGEG